MKFKYKGKSRKSGVYKITNIINGKVYIGSAKRFKERWKHHAWSLEKGCHHNTHLQAAFNLYGTNAFVFEVLEVVEGDKIARTIVEQRYLNTFYGGQCYNIDRLTLANDGPWSNNAEDSRRRIAEKAVERWKDPEFKASVSKKISISNTGKKLPASTRLKMSNAHVGHQVTEETGRKISAAKKGHKVSTEVREKISATLKVRNERRRQEARQATAGREAAAEREATGGAGQAEAGSQPTEPGSAPTQGARSAGVSQTPPTGQKSNNPETTGAGTSPA